MAKDMTGSKPNLSTPQPGGNSGNTKGEKSSTGGKLDFLPNTYEGAKDRGLGSKTGPGSVNLNRDSDQGGHTDKATRGKIDFLPDKPE